MSGSVAKLAGLYGIADSYLDYPARPRQESMESQAAILAALGIEARDEETAAAAIHQYETQRWTRLLPPVVVVASGEPIVVPIAVPLDLHATSVSWVVTREVGEPCEGTIRIEALATVEEGSAAGCAYRRVALRLPDCRSGITRPR